MPETTLTAWPLAGLAALGAFHGINPGMGWLLAVALGMQEQQRLAMWRALAALAAGHALAIAAAILVARIASDLVAGSLVRALIAGLLIALGVSRLIRSRHPRVGGSMRIGFAGLIGWSFLMATAHGAGLMALPLVLDAPVHAAGSHAGHVLAAGQGAWSIAIATIVHAAAYLAVTVAVAWVVYEKVGLAILRSAWINLDAIWAVALIVTGVAALVAA